MNFVQPQWRREGKRMELLLILWGIGVAVIHIHSSTVAWRGKISNCLLEQRPWVATKYSCVVMEINCVFTKKFSGHAGDIGASLVGVDPAMLKTLIFSCCPELEMPPQLQSLSALETIKIYNSTIREWNSSMALTASTHPVLQFLYMVDVNLSRIPEGMLSSEFPPTLVDVEFCGSNLTTLPDDLYNFWPNVDYLVLENSPGVREVPEALRRMKIRHLSLCSNAISVVPEYFFFANQSIQALELAGNPISKLPERDESIWSEPTELYAMSLGFTNISELPKWMQQLPMQPLSDALLTISAGETPLCRNGSTSENAATSSKMSEFVVVDCTVDGDLPIKLLYPVEAELEWRKESWSTVQ